MIQTRSAAFSPCLSDSANHLINVRFIRPLGGNGGSSRELVTTEVSHPFKVQLGYVPSERQNLYSNQFVLKLQKLMKNVWNLYIRFVRSHSAAL